MPWVQACICWARNHSLVLFYLQVYPFALDLEWAYNEKTTWMQQRNPLMDLASHIHCDIWQSPGPFSSLQLGLPLADTTARRRQLVGAQATETASGESWSPSIWCSQKWFLLGQPSWESSNPRLPSCRCMVNARDTLAIFVRRCWLPLRAGKGNK